MFKMLTTATDTVAVQSSTVPVFLVTWSGGGDGSAALVDLETLKTSPDWDEVGRDEWLMDRLERLPVLHSLYHLSVCQAVVFVRMSDSARDMSDDDYDDDEEG